MYLRTLRIVGFRCIADLTIHFSSGLNILIGENNAGKTTVIDALRICLTYGQLRRDVFVRTEDFHIDRTTLDKVSQEIQFHLYFQPDDKRELSTFHELQALNADGSADLQLHFRYYIVETAGEKRVQHKVWGGEKEGQSVSSELLQQLYYVHLGALRDAERNLRPIRGSHLGQLYTNLEPDESKQDNLAQKIHTTLRTDHEWTTLLDQGQVTINEHLRQSSILGKHRDIDIDFIPMDFTRIVERLLIQTPIYPSDLTERQREKQRYFSVHENGLGYNNILYAAAVLGDLQKRKQRFHEMYVALLIEEPEAHLHPQLQNVFFQYLGRLQEYGLQLFVTSHSPTITAKTDLKTLIVLQEAAGTIESVSVAQTRLEERNRKYLSRFLDVTKSQLFFAQGVLLVEGISEALLLPVLSKILGEKYSIETNGIEIVNVNGVAFEHFGKLFNATDSGARLGTRCAILTDDDRGLDGEISARAKKAKGLEGANLLVELAERTFEFELFSPKENRTLLLEILTELHPNAGAEIQGTSPPEAQLDLFVKKVATLKAKAELAHTLSIRLSEDVAARSRFKVPAYIDRAIKWVIGD